MSKQKVFPSVEELQTERLENIRCIVVGCNRLFKHSLALRFHVVKVHNIIEHFKQVHCPKKHVCLTCSSSFGRHSDLKRHSARCTLLTCNDCKQRMGSRDELIQHGNLMKHNIPQDDSNSLCKEKSNNASDINLTSNKIILHKITDKNIGKITHQSGKVHYPWRTIKPKPIKLDCVTGLYSNLIHLDSSLSKSHCSNNIPMHIPFTANATEVSDRVLKTSNLKAAQTQTMQLYSIKEKFTKSQGSQALFEYKKSQSTRENNQTQTNLSSNAFTSLKYNTLNQTYPESQIANFANSETQTIAEDSAEHMSTQTIESFLNWTKNMCNEVHLFNSNQSSEFVNLLNGSQRNAQFTNESHNNHNSNNVYCNHSEYNSSINLPKDNFQNMNISSKMKDNNCSTSTQTYYRLPDEEEFHYIPLNNIETQTNDDFLSLASDEFVVDLECMDIETQTHSIIDDFFFSEAQTQTSRQDQLNVLFLNIETQTHQ